MEKAEILNIQFRSVFSCSEDVTWEEISNSYKIPTEVFDDIENILSGITKLLGYLNPNTSPGQVSGQLLNLIK